MDVTECIPHELASQPAAEGCELERPVLEAFGLAEYQGGSRTRPALRRRLGFATRYELDGFLKAHGIEEGMTLEDFECHLETLGRVGL